MATDAERAAIRATLGVSAGVPVPTGKETNKAVEPGMRAARPGKDTSLAAKVQSFATGVGDTATGGNLGRIEAVSKALGPLGYDPLMTMGGAGVDSLMNMILGHGMVDSSAENKQVADTMQQNRGSSLMGQVVGAMLPGGAEAKLLEGGTHLLGKVAKPASEFAKSMVGRILSSGVLGGTSGGIYAKNKDEAVLPAVATGAVGGVLGQGVLGEALPAVVRTVGKTGSRTKALSDIGEYMSRPTGEVPSFETYAKAALLGDKATLADADPYAKEFLEMHLKGASRSGPLQPVANLMEKRAVEIPDDFQTTMQKLLPTSRAKDMTKFDTNKYFDNLQSTFHKALSNRSTMFEDKTLTDDVAKIFSGEALTTTDVAAGNGLLKEINSMASRGAQNEGREAGDRLLSPEQLHALRQNIDEQLKPMYEGGTRDNSTRKLLVAARNQISARLNEVPDFAAVNQQYATRASYQRAFDLGQEVLKDNNKSMSPEKITQWLSEANPGDTAGLLHGISSSLSEMLGKSEASTVKKLAINDAVGSKLVSAFGPKVAGEAIDAANNSLAMASTTRSIATAAKGGRAAFLKEQAEPATGKWTDIAFVASALTGVVSKALGGGAARRLLPGVTDPVYNKTLSDVFTGQGPEVIGKNLMDIRRATEGPIPVTLGGRDKALTAASTNAVPNLMTLDLGLSPGITSGLLFPPILSNSPNQQQRNAREYGK